MTNRNIYDINVGSHGSHGDVGSAIGRVIITAIIAVVAVVTPRVAAAQHVDSIGTEAGAMVVASNGDFAPHYISANNDGLVTQSTTALVRAAVGGRHSFNDRCKLQWGVEGVVDYASQVTYMRWNRQSATMVDNPQRPAAVWLQQLWSRFDYRSLFLQAGMKPQRDTFVNTRLSSGDIIRSNNARPLPAIAAGFNDFQPVPFTNGWVEIEGMIEYGKFTDNKWLRNHYGYYTGHINLGTMYTYKRCHLRTKSSKPFFVTVGMQAAGMYGGTTQHYRDGQLDSTVPHQGGIKGAVKMFLPLSGDDDYYYGSTLGSWDIKFSYRFKEGTMLHAYMLKPWETGSGIGFLNGFDGLWGVELKPAGLKWLSGLVVEYLDFTNQSGPVHFDPLDIPGCNLPAHTDGRDDYYNHYLYNAYANYGMSMGSSMLRGPIYNLDGYLGFVDNRVRGFHLALEGDVLPALSYRVMCGWRKGWGTYEVPRYEPVDATSFMLEGKYRFNLKEGALDLGLKLALDHGDMTGNITGCELTATYKFNTIH